MSGYDKLPDYGGPEPPKWYWALIALVVIAFFGGLVWASYAG